MTPILHNISLRQYCTYSETINYYKDKCKTIPWEADEWTLKAELRTEEGGSLVETLTVTGDSTGAVTLALSAAETSAMTAPASGTWDLLATQSGVRIPLAYGAWKIEQGSTQP